MKASHALILTSLPAALSWGNLGHQTIAYIAQDFLSASTQTWAKSILGDSSASYLAAHATWADTYRYTAAGKFSAGYHYIDAQDSPPSSCSVDYARDCGDDNCIVAAIANYTLHVQDQASASSQLLRNQSLMFLVHFLGDIHQPLHDEALAVGGNDIDVMYAGAATNLHHIWDTDMPEQYAGGCSLADARTWATELTAAIKSGSYKNLAQGWLSGMDVRDAKASALAWAAEANAFVCSSVFEESQAQLEKDDDLAGEYYEQALPVIKLQFAKAGYRLAAWLNLIATGKSS